MTPFLDVALIPPDPRVYVFVPRSEVVYPHNIVWSAVNVKKVFQSAMFVGEDVVREIWRHKEKIYYQVIGDEYLS